MGTRNVTCIFVEGEYRVAQYGQWDGYPDAAGVTILGVLRNSDLAKLKERVLDCMFLSDNEIEDRWVECGADRGSSMINMLVSDKFREKYPQLSREMGCKVVEFIYNAEGKVDLHKALDFVGSGLFCEWAYVIDLDEGTFEVYEGTGKDRHVGERFSSFHQDGEKYAAVGFKKSYPLDQLPTDERFLLDTEKGVVQ